METQSQKRITNVFEREDCRYHSEELFHRIITCYFPNIELRTKIQMHRNTVMSIRQHFLNYGFGWTEKEYFDYALKRIRESYYTLTKNGAWK